MRLVPGGRPQEIDLRGRSVRSRVHEYGGGAFCLLPPRAERSTTRVTGAGWTSGPRIAFVDQTDQAVLLAEVGGDGAPAAGAPAEGAPSRAPGERELRPLSQAAPAGERWYHGDLWPAPGGGGVLAIRERHRDGTRSPARELVLLPVSATTDTIGSAPTPHPGRVLFDGTDFVASARGGPAEGRGWWLAWITWDHPDMPWDASHSLGRSGRDRLRR